MLDVYKLLGEFPERAEDFIVGCCGCEVCVRLKEFPDDVRQAVDLSELSFVYDAEDRVYLKYLSISENFKDKGYGRRVIRELIRQAHELGLEIYTDLAYDPVIHIVRTEMEMASYKHEYYEKALGDGEYSFLIRFLK